MNKVLNFTYERAKRGELNDIVLEVIHDEDIPIQDRLACMRIWYRAVDHGRWDRREVETILSPIIERRKRTPEPVRTSLGDRSALLIQYKDKNNSN